MLHHQNDILLYPAQNYSCITCGKCCRLWDVPVTKTEKEKIEKLKISGLPAEIKKCFRPDRKRKIFLIEKHRGKCVFLNEDNLCLIHKVHGEAAKPLACRLYPFDVFNWKDGAISASFRFDCPAVAQFKGKKIISYKDPINSFARELSKSGIQAYAVYSKKLNPGLYKLRIIASAYQNFLINSSIKPSIRVCAAARLLEFHSNRKNSRDISKAGRSFIDNAGQLVKRSINDLQSEIDSAGKLNIRQRIIFRYILSGFLRSDEDVALKFSITGRVSRAKKLLDFCLGQGMPKNICRDFPVDSQVDPLQVLSEAELSETALNPYWNYLGSKFASLHFCGYPVKELTFEEGIRQMLITYPVVVSFASAIALNGQRRTIEESDVSNALMFVDHTFSRSPFFALKHVRRIIRELCGKNTFAAILKLMKN